MDESGEPIDRVRAYLIGKDCCICGNELREDSFGGYYTFTPTNPEEFFAAAPRANATRLVSFASCKACEAEHGRAAIGDAVVEEMARFCKECGPINEEVHDFRTNKDD